MKPFGLFLVSTTTLFPAYQLSLLPNVDDKLALFSQYLGIASLILMAWSQIFATRIPGIEPIFGGLDRIYVLHKWAGITALFSILLHDTIDADMGELGPGTMLSDIAETLGELSLYGFLILAVISVATFIPYHLWKWTHKAMGAFFVASTVHFVLIPKPFTMSDPVGLYAGLFCLTGCCAYIWTLLPDEWRLYRKYEISGLEKTGGALAITLRPKGKRIKPMPGQFALFDFFETGKSESHPFSFSKIDEGGSLRVTIRAQGDYTHRLEDGVAVGQSVNVQGPFGRFGQKTGKKQIWIAGGIGITPLIAKAYFLAEDVERVDLFYCVRSRSKAPHLDEIQALLVQQPKMRLHLIASEDGRRLSANLVANTVGNDLSRFLVAFCGPVSLRRAMQSDLRRFGVTSRNFHFEEFEFRTGIGLRRLAQRLIGRAHSL